MQRDRIITISLVLLGVLIAAVLWQSRLSYPIDDTFITFRYAENLAHGYGLVWNPQGPPTEGYTNFLYVLLLAPFAALGLDLLIVAQSINVLAVIVCGVSLYKISSLLASGSKSSLSAFGAVLFLLTPMTWANALSGMETVVFGALLLLGFYLTQRSETTNTAGYCVLFLASLVRPEGLLLAILIAAFNLYRFGWRSIRPFVFLVILPTALYYLWKLWYFEHLLPNSFAVKVTQSAQESESLLQGTQAVKLFIMRTWPLIVASLVAVWLNPKRSTIIAFVWAMLIIVAYAVPVPLMGFFDRFFFSSEVFLYTLAGVAIVKLGDSRSRQWGIGSALLLLGSLIFTNLQSPRAKEVIVWDLSDINERLAVIASDLKSLPHADTIQIASSDAGIVPYYSKLDHFDLAGLNTTSIAHSHTNGETIENLLAAKPEVLLLSSDWSPLGASDTCRHISRAVHGRIGAAMDNLLHDPRFSTYRPKAVFLTGVYDYSILLDTASPYYSALDSAFSSRLNANIFYLKRLSCID